MNRVKRKQGYEPGNSYEKLLKIVTAKLNEIAKDCRLQAGGPENMVYVRDQLRQAKTGEDRLKWWRLVRDIGLFSQEEAFTGIATAIDQIADERITQMYKGVVPNASLRSVADRLTRISEEMDAVRKAHGATGDDWAGIGEGPEEYRALSAECETLYDRVIAETMREHGEADMADLFETDRAEYWRRWEAGLLPGQQRPGGWVTPDDPTTGAGGTT